MNIPGLQSAHYPNNSAKPYSVKESSPNLPLAFISDLSGFAGQILPALLQNELGCECTQFEFTAPLVDSADLVVIDCQNIEPKQISIWLQKNLNRCKSIALVKMPHDTKYEHLIEWPKVNGMFYLEATDEQIAQGIRRVLLGDYWLPRRLLNAHLEKSRESHHGKIDVQLTPRESEILKLIKRSATNAEIGEKLSLSENTVKSHLYKAYKKIGVVNRLDACNWARLNIE
ncbi:LuxR C-terminal-related transcriptional regulator [Sessilibacter corallicola]|uniref:HTH luxR-type domain-containing protein n=1 Tax=Sessilibacter corallicola TaxID=2904075 RepID=A0ABQ0ADS0_9GAMM|nr:LuxR C-terminal-related transcriptional regulator [Sessilibacter corallicola]MCE2027359.1 LuxR C-terminal-related transcriptional regulator [Sessilibacter corallicola]